MKSEAESLENLEEGLVPDSNFLATPGPSGTLVPGAAGEGLGTAPHVGTEAGNPEGGWPPAQVSVSCLSHLPLLSPVRGVLH